MSGVSDAVLDLAAEVNAKGYNTRGWSIRTPVPVARRRAGMSPTVVLRFTGRKIRSLIYKEGGMEEIRLMKGNEVVAEAAVRCGCDGYFGYPITPPVRNTGNADRDAGRGRRPVWSCCRPRAKWRR